MAKTEVYSWRLDPVLKGELEQSARRRGVSIAELLEGIAGEWLAQDGYSRLREADEQQRLRANATRFIGSFAGGDPERAAQAKQRVRQRLQDLHVG
jgi:hypothetical protein